jgi:hypothetical protein
MVRRCRRRFCRRATRVARPPEALQEGQIPSTITSSKTSMIEERKRLLEVRGRETPLLAPARYSLLPIDPQSYSSTRPRARTRTRNLSLGRLNRQCSPRDPGFDDLMPFGVRQGEGASDCLTCRKKEPGKPTGNWISIVSSVVEQPSS